MSYSTTETELWSIKSALLECTFSRLFSTCAGSLLSSDGFAPWRRSFTSQLRVCTKCQLGFTSPCLCFCVGFTVSLPCQDGSRDRNGKQSLAGLGDFILLEDPPQPHGPHGALCNRWQKQTTCLSYTPLSYTLCSYKAVSGWPTIPSCGLLLWQNVRQHFFPGNSVWISGGQIIFKGFTFT